MRRKILIFAKYLKKEGDRVYLFSVTPPEREYKNDIFEEIYIPKKGRCIKKIIRCLKNPLKKPIQITLYNEPEVIKEFRKYMKRVKPDVVFIDYIRSGDYGINIKIPKIINYDDPQSLKFKRMKKFLKEIKNPFGEGINFLPNVVKGILSLPFIKTLILSHEIYTLRKYEVKLSRYYPMVLTNSVEDANYLKRNGVKNIGFLPPLVDKEFYVVNRGKKESDVITFIGKMDYPPNPHAVEYFAREILPEIERIYKNHFEFRVIGANTPSWLFKFSEKNEKIKIVGEVEDVRPHLSQSTVFVAPLKFGTGIKVKIIEAMALGVPVVTTSVGVQGMDVENGVHLFVEDEIGRFAGRVVSLLKHKSLREKLVKNAREYVFKNFDAEKYTKKLREYFKSSIKSSDFNL